MNYKVRRQGVDLGIFSLEELRQRREAGEFNGGEYVQATGKSDWQPLDLVLQRGYQATPPPLPSSTSRTEPSHLIIWVILAVGVILYVAVIGIGVRRGIMAAKGSHNYGYHTTRSAAAVAAARPVPWPTNSWTEADTRARNKDFRMREWVDGYEQRGQRHPADDAQVDKFLRDWVEKISKDESTDGPLLAEESTALAADTNCTDPLALTAIANTVVDRTQSIDLLERALDEFPASNHRAYPQLSATTLLEEYLGKESPRIDGLDAAALPLFRKCFADGSITTNDQQRIADTFVNGWGKALLARQGAAVCQTVDDAGPGFQWLALTLHGENEINLAWAARGTGYGDTVTTQGWQGFNDHLQSARSALTKAWRLHPDFPAAPCRMITVALGDSDITEMRLWFDRTVTAQIDYLEAWSSLRWGLRPRWGGDLDSMLIFGRTALNSGRYDTYVPRQFLNSVYDVEAENEVSQGHHLFGRPDIWPDLQRMYEGYIAAPSQLDRRGEWRTAYAAVAYIANQYSVARTQLEAVNWQPESATLTAWGLDPTVMPLEVAARTGSLGSEISTAETAYTNGETAEALKKYSGLDTNNADARTREFIQSRLATLRGTKPLVNGEWVDFLPMTPNDPDWRTARGHIRHLEKGAVVIESGPTGHFISCRTPVGPDFEVRGSFEVVHPSDKNFFQAGLVFGSPDFHERNWYDFRLRRDKDGDQASIGRGWTKSETFFPIHLNDMTNSFDFTFQNGRATASVNGVEIFHQMAPPVAISQPVSSYTLGMGGYTKTNTVIRYRDIHVRQLN